jgi:dephospho-CoA kinase
MNIGIIGQSGAGKTRITEYFKQHGYIIIEADKIVHLHYLYHSSSIFVNKLAKIFGNKIINKETKDIDRGKLGKIVFNSKRQMNKLNKIMIPVIEKDILNIIGYSNQNFIIDGALLGETKIIEKCNMIIYVKADRKIRLNRLIKRGVKKEIAKKMVDAVKTNVDKINKKCIILTIDNNGTEIELVEELIKIGRLVKW